MDDFLLHAQKAVEAWPVWLTTITTLVTAATAITTITPTEVDNRIVNALLQVLHLLAGNVGKNARPKDEA